MPKPDPAEPDEPRDWSGLRRLGVQAARATGLLLLVAATVAGGHLVLRYIRTSDAFSVQRMDIQGAQKLSRREILHTAGLHPGMNIFETIPEEASRRLRKHPWIATATVQRELPDRLLLTVREHRSAAILAFARPDTPDSAPSTYLVSERGTVLKALEPRDTADLPVITGVDPVRFAKDLPWRASVLVQAVAILHEYRGAGLWKREPVSELHVGAGGSVTLYVGSDGMQVRMGKPPFGTKLRRLRQILNRLERKNARPAYVYLHNMRRPNRVAVALND